LPTLPTGRLFDEHLFIAIMMLKANSISGFSRQMLWVMIAAE
jgi:hypothetical protein